MKHPFTHTVLRYVHDTTTGEFINVGVAIYSREARYASALCRNTIGRLSKAFPGMDGEAFKSLMRYIQSRMEEVGDGLQKDLPFEGLPESVMEVAHRVLPPDDSSLQWSPPGSGLSDNLPQTLESLFQRHVMRYENRASASAHVVEEIESHTAYR